MQEGFIKACSILQKHLIGARVYVACETGAGLGGGRARRAYIIVSMCMDIRLDGCM